MLVRNGPLLALGAAAGLFTQASAHIALWHPSMWGFNVVAETFSYDNRPVIPLMGMSFKQWWFHGHLDYPPAKGQFFDLPAGGTATAELACDKGATSYYASSPGGDIRQGNWPCPGQDSTQFHANNEADTTGCALAITYKSDVSAVQPEDFAVFSTNRKCVWTRFTDFEVPKDMPACPPEGCICAWFWIHAADSGSEQNYMNGFRCKVSGATSVVPVAKPQLARRCGADQANGRSFATPQNCTDTARQPFYWYQNERNNMKEGTYSPPLYNELYGYENGAQNYIFEKSGNTGGNNGGDNGGNANAAPATTTKAAVVATTKAATHADAPTTHADAPTTHADAPTTHADAPTTHAAAPTSKLAEQPKPTTSVKQPEPETSSPPPAQFMKPTSSHAAAASSSSSPHAAVSSSSPHAASSSPHAAATSSSHAAAPAHTKTCKSRKARREEKAAKEAAALAERDAHIKRHRARLSAMH